MDKFSQDIEKLYELAAIGNPEAQCRLGEYFEAKDNEQSVYWYEQAARQEHVDAMYALAYMYEYGLGVEPNYAKALDLYLRCTEHSNGKDAELAFCACKDVASFLEEGKGVDKDVRTAIDWYERAAEGNVMSSQDCSHVARLYELGEGIEVNYKSAAEWYLMADDYGKLSELYSGALCDPAKAQYFQSKCTLNHYYTINTELMNAPVSIDYLHVVREFDKYYQEQYSIDLQYVYSLNYDENKQILTADIADLSLDTTREMLRRIGDNIYYFSIATFFQTLLPQVVEKVLGPDFQYEVYRCTGWPNLFNSRNGFAHPFHVLLDSILCPGEEMLDDYLFVFSRIRRIIIERFLDFLEGHHENLNQAAYSHLVKESYSYLWEIEQECEIQCDLFRMWLNNPSLPFKSQL